MNTEAHWNIMVGEHIHMPVGWTSWGLGTEALQPSHTSLSVY